MFPHNQVLEGLFGGGEVHIMRSGDEEALNFVKKSAQLLRTQRV
jgi:hypothetical protein